MVIFLILLALAVIAYFIFKPKPTPPITTTTTTTKFEPQPTTTSVPTTVAPTTTDAPTTTLSPCQCGKPKIYSVSLIRDSLLRLSFDINGIDCNAITYEYSRNPLGPWNRSTSGISSPHDIDINDASGTWYFRLIKECKNGCQSEPSDIAIYVY